LVNPDPDTSVAFGAVVHGMALKGYFSRVTGGSARHYFLLTETQEGESVGVCLLPKGTQEAVPMVLENRRFKLTTGQTVAFRVATSTDDRRIELGEVYAPAEHWHALPPLVLRLDEAENGASEVDVLLRAELTELGILELSCSEHIAGGESEVGRTW